MDTEIKHDPNDLRFYADLAAEQAELTYTYTEKDVLDLDYTFVPEAYRGKGIADALVKASLEFAQENHYRVILSCPVAEAFVKRHPEFEDLVKEV